MNGSVGVASKNIKKFWRRERLNIMICMTNFYLLCTLIELWFVHQYASRRFLSLWNGSVLQVEVEIPFLRVLMEVELEEKEWRQACYEQLNFIEEKRMKALCHGQCYQRRIARAYDKNMKPMSFPEATCFSRKFFPSRSTHEEIADWIVKGPFSLRMSCQAGFDISLNRWGAFPRAY